MRIVMRPFWRLVDGARDRAAWALDNLSRTLYQLEERIREERTLVARRDDDEGAVAS